MSPTSSWIVGGVCLISCILLAPCFGGVQLPRAPIPQDPRRFIFSKEGNDILGGRLHLSYDLKAVPELVQLDGDPRVLDVACFAQESLAAGGLGHTRITLSDATVAAHWIEGVTLLQGGPRWGCQLHPGNTDGGDNEAFFHGFQLRVMHITFIDVHPSALNTAPLHPGAVVVGLAVHPTTIAHCFEKFDLTFWRQRGPDEDTVVNQLEEEMTAGTRPTHPLARRLSRWDKMWHKNVRAFTWNTDSGYSYNTKLLPISSYKGMFCEGCYAYLGIDFNLRAYGDDGYWYDELWYLKATVTVSARAALRVAYQSQGSYAYSREKELTDFRSFGTYSVPTPVATFSLKIEGRVRAGVIAKASYNSVVKSPGGALSGSLTLGFKYSDGSVHSVSDSSAALEMSHGPEFALRGSASLRLNLFFDVKFTISAWWGLASGAATFSFNPYLLVKGAASATSACGTTASVKVDVYRGMDCTIQVGDFRLVVKLTGGTEFGPYALIPKKRVRSYEFSGCM